MKSREKVEKVLDYNIYGNSSATDQQHRDMQTLLLLDIRDLLEKGKE